MGFNFHAVCPWEHTSCLCRGISLGCGRSGSDQEGAVSLTEALHGYKPLIMFPSGFLPSAVDRAASRVSASHENLLVFK